MTITFCFVLQPYSEPQSRNDMIWYDTLSPSKSVVHQPKLNISQFTSSRLYNLLSIHRQFHVGCTTFCIKNQTTNNFHLLSVGVLNPSLSPSRHTVVRLLVGQGGFPSLANSIALFVWSWSWSVVWSFPQHLPSGDLLHSYWKWPIYSWFTY